MRRPVGLASLAAALGACGGEAVAPSGVSPAIEAASVAANPGNVLSAIVTVQARDADSVAVRYAIASAAGDSLTPAVAAGQVTLVPVLGLLPATRYVLRAVAFGRRGMVEGPELQFTTEPLPVDVPRFTATGTSPTPGYVVFAAGLYGIVIDNTGRVVWYRRFANGLGLSFAAQPVGRYVARQVTPDPNDIDPWVELDPLGNPTRTLTCAGGLPPRYHDILVEPNGDYWIMCDETRTMDLTADGGVADAQVIGTALQHVSSTGTLLFHWSPFAHFAITDVATEYRTGAVVNWMHGNAIDLDEDGNLLVSFRNLNEVTKIDVNTGRIIWRLGGRRNQFTFVGTPIPAFAQQHSIRFGGSGSLLLLDNVGDPAESGAERYVLDEETMTARVMRSYSSLPGVVTQIGGSTQALPGGNTLVSFGTAGRVEEYDPSGRVVWRIDGNAGYVFRAQRIPSLYTPGAGATR